MWMKWKDAWKEGMNQCGDGSGVEARVRVSGRLGGHVWGKG